MANYNPVRESSIRIFPRANCEPFSFKETDGSLDCYTLDADKLYKGDIHLFIQNSDLSPADVTRDKCNTAACAVMTKFRESCFPKQSKDFVMEQWGFRHHSNFLAIMHYAFPEKCSLRLSQLASLAGFSLSYDKVLFKHETQDKTSHNILVDLAKSDKIVLLCPKLKDDEKQAPS